MRQGTVASVGVSAPSMRYEVASAGIARSAPGVGRPPARAVRRAAPGLVLDFDLGVGEAPYDDGFRSRRLVDDHPLGFSDALVQLGFRRSIGSDVHLIGTASAVRVQDEPLASVLSGGGLSFLMVGVGFSW